MPGINTGIGVRAGQNSGSRSWTQPIPVSAIISNSDATKVLITFSVELNDTLPATSAFSLYGKTISGVSLDATKKILTLTVTAGYTGYDVVIAAVYTQPGSNPLKSAGGNKLVSSFILDISNNVLSSLLTGIQAYYKLNEASGTRDELINGLDVAEVNGTVDASTIGAFPAAQFDTVESRYLSHDDDALLRGGDSDFTFVALVRFDSFNASFGRGILGKYSANREYSLIASTGATTSKLTFIVSSDGSATAGKITTLSYTDFGNLAINTNYLVFAYHDAANDKIGLKINKATAQEAAHAGGVFGYTNTFQIGAYNASQFMSGKVALVSKWAKLLNDNEKKHLYNFGNFLQYPFTVNKLLFPQKKLLHTGSGIYASTASRLNHQRNLFQAAGRCWVFYGDYTDPAPYDLYFTSSLDRQTWTDAVNLTTFPVADAQWDVRYDGTHVHIVKNIQSAESPGLFHDGLLYRRGTPNADGTITWDADWQTVLAAGNYAGDICLCVTANGHVFVGYGNKGSDDATHGDAIIVKNANTDGTWQTATGFPKNITNANDRNYFISLTKLGTSGIYAVVNGWGVAEKLIGYYSADGGSTFASDGEISTLTIKGAPAQYVGTEETLGTPDGKIHLVYYSNGDKVIYRQRSAAGVWADEVELQVSGDINANDTCPRLSVDNDDNIYVTWEGGDNVWCAVFKDGAWKTRVQILDDAIERTTAYTHLMTIEDNFESNRFQFTELLTGFKLTNYIMDLSEL